MCIPCAYTFVYHVTLDSIIDPYGHEVTEPVWDKEEIIYAELDMQAVPASRMEHDACGHYSRPDILHLEVKENL